MRCLIAVLAWWSCAAEPTLPEQGALCFVEPDGAATRVSFGGDEVHAIRIESRNEDLDGIVRWTGRRGPILEPSTWAGGEPGLDSSEGSWTARVGLDRLLIQRGGQVWTATSTPCGPVEERLANRAAALTERHTRAQTLKRGISPRRTVVLGPLSPPGEPETGISVELPQLTYMKHELTRGLRDAITAGEPEPHVDALLPVGGLSFADAARLANALSRHQKLPEVYTITDTEVRWHQDREGWRLPTGDEWEMLARSGGEARDLSRSEAMAGFMAWHQGNGRGRLHPVGTKRSDDMGGHDFFGNAEEWVWDVEPGQPPAEVLSLLEDGSTRGGSAADPIDRMRSWEDHRRPRGIGSPLLGVRFVYQRTLRKLK